MARAARRVSCACAGPWAAEITPIRIAQRKGLKFDVPVRDTRAEHGERRRIEFESRFFRQSWWAEIKNNRINKAAQTFVSGSFLAVVVCAVLARPRARILVLPDRLAPLCHEETAIAGFPDQIRKAVREAFDELAATPVVIAADPDRTGAADEGGADSAGDPDAAGAFAQ